MKILDVDRFRSEMRQIQKQLAPLNRQVEQLHQAVNQITDLDEALRGNIGESIRNYFHEIHHPFLLYLQNFLVNYDKSLDKISDSLSQFEPANNGYIHENFVNSNIRLALREIKTVTEDLTNDVNQRIRQVNDIIHLPNLYSRETLRSIDEAERKARDVVEELNEFDRQATSSLDPVEKDLETMTRYIKQMQASFKEGKISMADFSPKKLMDIPAYRGLLGEAITKLDKTPVQTIEREAYGNYRSIKYHVYEDGLILMEYQKIGSDHRFYYEVVTEVPEEIEDGVTISIVSPTLDKISAGFYEGSGKVVQDTIDGVKWLFDSEARNKTAMELGFFGAGLYLDQETSMLDVGKYMGQAIKDGFEQKVTNGDAESRTEYLTHVFGGIGISIIGDKGISKVGQIGKIGRIGYVGKVKPALNNLTPSPSAAGVGPIPYNVMNDLSNQIQQATKEAFDGRVEVGKYNNGTMKHLYHGEVNKRGKAVGYHHESMMGGKIIPSTEQAPDKNGVYMAKVEIDGVRKVADSSFFPKAWNRVDVLQAIDEAYQTKQKIGANKYRGVTSSGIKIEMYMNKDGSIATAYPLYKK